MSNACQGCVRYWCGTTRRESAIALSNNLHVSPCVMECVGLPKNQALREQGLMLAYDTTVKSVCLLYRGMIAQPGSLAKLVRIFGVLSTQVSYASFASCTPTDELDASMARA